MTDAARQLHAWVNGGTDVPLEEVLAYFDGLPAVHTEEMLGSWDGAIVPTGHAGERRLGGLRWAGKDFHDANRVDPLICLNDDGKRFANPVLGAAQLRNVEYRGVVTATMVYDEQPILDHFRRVDDGLVIGVMDQKGQPEPLVFCLRRS